MLSHCVGCASRGQSCCQNVKIYLTLGDVERIAKAGQAGDFFALEPLTPEYEDGGGDAEWNPLILNPDGRRRVIRQKDGGDCWFLGPAGCGLSSEVRPLLCRVYPYDFREYGLHGICPSCPVSREADWQRVLENSEMRVENVLGWINQLYAEIRKEKTVRC